jgi:hypothetical protein
VSGRIALDDDYTDRPGALWDHINADHDALRRCWELAQTWRQLAADVTAASRTDTRWLLGAAMLLEDAIKGTDDDDDAAPGAAHR